MKVKIGALVCSMFLIGGCSNEASDSTLNDTSEPFVSNSQTNRALKRAVRSGSPRIKANARPCRNNMHKSLLKGYDNTKMCITPKPVFDEVIEILRAMGASQLRSDYSHTDKYITKIYVFEQDMVDSENFINPEQIREIAQMLRVDKVHRTGVAEFEETFEERSTEWVINNLDPENSITEGEPEIGYAVLGAIVENFYAESVKRFTFSHYVETRDSGIFFRYHILVTGSRIIYVKEVQHNG